MWNIKYRNADMIITTAGYVKKEDLEEEGYTVVEGFDGPVPELMRLVAPGTPTWLKKYNEETGGIEDVTL